MYFKGKFVIISCTVLIICCLSLTWGLKCYQCQLKDGTGDAGCGENPPPEKYLRECAQPQCWLRHSNNGTLHVERFCVAVASNINGCLGAMVIDDKGTQHTGMECKCSDTDGCNGRPPSGIHGGAGGSNSSGSGDTSGSSGHES